MSSDTLIREVDEELRRDRVRKLWRQTAPFVIGGAVLIVLVVAGYEGWTWWQKSQSAKSSDQFYAAATVADGTDLAAAKTALDAVIAQGSGGYPMLAQFREAALLSQQGKTAEAVAAYDNLGNSLNNTHLRELALILAGNELIDGGDVNAVQQRVGGSINPSSPLRNAAREVLGLAQYKAGKLDDAMKSFTDVINDPLATSDTRSRVQIYTLQLLAEGAKPIAPPVDETTTPSQPPSPEVSTAPADVSSQASVASSAPAAPSESAEVSSQAPAVSSASAEISSVAPVASSAPADASASVEVAPPVVVDTSMMDLATPEASSALSSVASSAPLPSSSAP
jgi:hypothetical protein